MVEQHKCLDAETLGCLGVIKGCSGVIKGCLGV